MYKKGFTIVELVVVVAIIGILVGIGAVTYRGYQEKAYDAAVLSDFDAIAGLLESYRQKPANLDKYPIDKPALETLGIKVTKSAYNTSIATNIVYCIAGNTDSKSYALIALSKSGNYFMMNQTGMVTYTYGASAFLNPSSLCTTISSSMWFVSSAWNASDSTTGPWRLWSGGN